MEAIDRDEGFSGLIHYCVVSPDEPYFTIDYISGAVLTKAEIDFEKVGAFIILFISKKGMIVVCNGTGRSGDNDIFEIMSREE